MKALTVQQPWAWAIIHGGKSVENRTQAWSYRGPLAIHAGSRVSQRGLDSPLIEEAWWRDGYGDQDDIHDVTWDAGGSVTLGAIIGVVDLVDIHLAADGCCESPWAETSYVEHGDRTRRDIVHLVLQRPRPLAVPVPCRGALGLWMPPAEVLEQLQADQDQAERPICPHGDPSCPCPDGLMCHYEGPEAWPEPERHVEDQELPL